MDSEKTPTRRNIMLNAVKLLNFMKPLLIALGLSNEEKKPDLKQSRAFWLQCRFMAPNLAEATPYKKRIQQPAGSIKKQITTKLRE
jgi:hypothetical protein